MKEKGWQSPHDHIPHTGRLDNPHTDNSSRDICLGVLLLHAGKKSHRCPRGYRHNVTLFDASLKPPGAIVLWCWNGSRRALNYPPWYRETVDSWTVVHLIRVIFPTWLLPIGGTFKPVLAVAVNDHDLTRTARCYPRQNTPWNALCYEFPDCILELTYGNA